ncbi:gibberellin-regulated protein 6 [Pyrus ussuriensis x Pyrus communis]|uniref:Gibberellin-regulated protein 6 n=1 Tax=Pyrus ussuriensis x Pyrus communis TaxID=2448454 RepID=A0A5N5I543_9ROSA|nr:gibberellin-regulated protein 6 [Pyrus ussuriensis x Pyrus communis]
MSLIRFSRIQTLLALQPSHGKRHKGSGSLKSYQYSSQCTGRCSHTQYHKPCMFFCQKCCAKCLCVPPGFHGNKAVCPCYNNWKTQLEGPKCPRSTLLLNQVLPK